MTREDEIIEKAGIYSSEQSEGKNEGIDDFCFEAFCAGAEWADNHPKNFWHSVADGDLPDRANGDAIDPPFLVMGRDGNTFMAYYGRDEEDGEMNFFDDCGLALAVDYWMEMPKLPNKEKL